MTVFSERQWSLLRLLGERLVPPLRELDAEGQRRFLAIIAGAVAARPAEVQRQLRLFLKFMHLAPLLRWAATFEALPAARQDRFLRWLQDAAPNRLRQGFWGVKTIVFMGYYGQAELAARLAYTPSRTGNEKLHA